MLDQFVQQISIRGNLCNPRLNESVGQAWQKTFELKAQKNHCMTCPVIRDFHAAQYKILFAVKEQISLFLIFTPWVFHFPG